MTDVVACGPEMREEWNEFAAWAPGGDVLQSWEWGDLKGRGEWTPVRLAVREGGRITAGMSLLRRSINLPGKSFFYASRGPLLREWSPERLERLIGGARDLAREHGAVFIKVDPALCDPSHADMLRGEGFVPAADGDRGFGGTQPRCVMTLDLGPAEDDLMKAFKPKWRYNIRLAERKGVTVQTDGGRDDLGVFYDLLRVTAERDGFRIRGARYFEDMWDCLAPSGMIRLFLARCDGEPLAGALCTLFGPVCCYTYGASSNASREKMPNYLMQWTMIRWARDHGFHVYDFRGVSPRGSSSPAPRGRGVGEAEAAGKGGKAVDGTGENGHAGDGKTAAGGTGGKGTAEDGAAGDRLAGLNRFKEGFGARFVEYIGEYDLPLSPIHYRLWRSVMPVARRVLRGRHG